MGELIPVDMDLVRELRRQGRCLDAQALIRTHQEHIVQEKKQLRKEIHTQDSLIIRHIKNGFAHNRCVDCSLVLPSNKPRRCTECQRKHRNTLERERYAHG